MEQSELSEQNLKDKYESKNKLKVNSMVPVIFKHKTNIKKDDIYKGKLSSDKKLNDIEEIKIKIGNEKSINLLSRQTYKFNNAIMVSGVICDEGLGEIIFHGGNLNSFAINKF